MLGAMALWMALWMPIISYDNRPRMVWLEGVPGIPGKSEKECQEGLCKAFREANARARVQKRLLIKSPLKHLFKGL